MSCVTALITLSIVSPHRSVLYARNTVTALQYNAARSFEGVFSTICRNVTLEARLRGGPLGLPYVPKYLETFKMAVQRLVLIHP